MLTRQNQQIEGRGRATSTWLAWAGTVFGAAAVATAIALAGRPAVEAPGSFRSPERSQEAAAPAAYLPGGPGLTGSVYDGGAYGARGPEVALPAWPQSSSGYVDAYGPQKPAVSVPAVSVGSDVVRPGIAFGTGSVYDGGAYGAQEPVVSVPAVSVGSDVVRPGASSGAGSAERASTIPAVSLGLGIDQPIGIDATGLPTGYTDYIRREDLRAAAPSRNYPLGVDLPAGANAAELPAGFTDYLRAE